MSDYGTTRDEFDMIKKNARETKGLLFSFDRAQLSDDDILKILESSYK